MDYKWIINMDYKWIINMDYKWIINDIIIGYRGLYPQLLSS